MLIPADMLGTIPQKYITSFFTRTQFASGKIIQVEIGEPVATEDIVEDKGSVVLVKPKANPSNSPTPYHPLCKSFRSVSLIVKTNDEQLGDIYASISISMTKIGVSDLGTVLSIGAAQGVKGDKKGLDLTSLVGVDLCFRVEARPYGSDGEPKKGTYERYTFFADEPSWSAAKNLYAAIANKQPTHTRPDPLGLTDGGAVDASDDYTSDSVQDLY